MVGRVFPSHGGGDHEVVGRVESPHPGTRPVGNPPRRLTPPPLPWRGIRSDTSAANSPPAEGGTTKWWGGFSPPAEGGTTKWWGGSPESIRSPIRNLFIMPFADGIIKRFIRIFWAVVPPNGTKVICRNRRCAMAVGLLWGSFPCGVVLGVQQRQRVAVQLRV